MIPNGLGVRSPAAQRELADLTGLDAVYIAKLVRALERAGSSSAGMKA